MASLLQSLFVYDALLSLHSPFGDDQKGLRVRGKGMYMLEPR